MLHCLTFMYAMNYNGNYNIYMLNMHTLRIPIPNYVYDSDEYKIYWGDHFTSYIVSHCIQSIQVWSP